MDDPQQESGYRQEADEEGAVIGRAFRRSLLVVLAVGAVVGLLLWAKQPANTPAPPPEPVRVATRRQPELVHLPSVPFTDITQTAGIDFVHQNGAYGDKLLPETMGGGCAYFDFDNDGDQDLLLVGSEHWPGHQPAGTPPPTLALYRNDGTGKFADVTEAVGLAISCYGMGAAVGDYDNDGDTDLLVTAVGENRLFRNDFRLESPAAGFSEVTGEAGVAGDPAAWSSSAAWIDYDNDGDLDLLVGNYIRWSREIDLAQNYTLLGVGRAYGPPTSFSGSHPYLYRNEGSGRFADVTRAAGLEMTNEATGLPMAKSLGLAPVDLDSDGWIDFIMANDTVRNLVFHNRGDGTFEEIGVVAGIAYDSTGRARGAMGIDTLRFGDHDDDDLAVAIGNFANEMTAFYCTHGDPLLFSDDAVATGIGPRTRLTLTFGLLFFDVDLDGRRDLLAANGHLEEEISRVQESQHYRQSAQLFFNVGRSAGNRFVPATEAELGRDFFTPLVGRGAAFADIDADGDLDLVLTQIAGPPRLLRNDQALGRHWIRLKLVGNRSNRSAIGARVRVQIGDQVLHRQVMPTRSYLSQVELPMTVGLGELTSVDQITIRWPGGAEQQVQDVSIDAETTIEQE
jgi:hypothetical protein